MESKTIKGRIDRNRPSLSFPVTPCPRSGLVPRTPLVGGDRETGRRYDTWPLKKRNHLNENKMGILKDASPGIISGGLQMANTAIQGRQARKNMKVQFGYDTKRAAQQFEYDTQAWNRTNTYNSPEQVMARYKEAGLNPNLIYGGGMGNTAGSAPAQQAVAPDARRLPPTVMLPEGVLSQYQDFTMKRVQTDNLKKQAQILEEERINKQLENEWLKKSMFGRLENVTNDYLLKSRKYFEMGETWPYRFTREGITNKSLEAKIESLTAGTDLAKQKKAQLDQLFPGQLEMQGLGIEKARRGLNILQLQKLAMQSKIDYQKMVNDYYEEMFYLNAGKALAQGAAPMVDMLINYGKSRMKGKVGAWSSRKPK